MFDMIIFYSIITLDELIVFPQSADDDVMLQVFSFGGKHHSKSESEMREKGKDLIQSLSEGAISLDQAKEEADAFVKMQ